MSTFGFWNFIKGIRIVPKAGTSSSNKGEMDVNDTDSKLYYHNGTTGSPLVTESHTATLSNKTLTAPIVNNLVWNSGLLQLPSANDTASGSNQTLSAVTTPIVRLTNGSLASIDMIPAPAGTNFTFLSLINATGVTVVINNETGGTAANRILTGTAASIDLQTDAVLYLVYDVTSTRWRVIGGSSSGLPRVFGSRGTPRSVVAANGITVADSHMSATSDEQIIFVEGSVSGDNLISANPQIQAGTKIGQRITLIGRNSSKTLSMNNGNGVELEGSVSLNAGTSLVLQWDGTSWTELNRSN